MVVLNIYQSLIEHNWLKIAIAFAYTFTAMCWIGVWLLSFLPVKPFKNGLVFCTIRSTIHCQLWFTFCCKTIFYDWLNLNNWSLWLVLCAFHMQVWPVLGFYWFNWTRSSDLFYQIILNFEAFFSVRIIWHQKFVILL